MTINPTKTASSAGPSVNARITTHGSPLRDKRMAHRRLADAAGAADRRGPGMHQQVLADELLAHAARHEREVLDEKLYFEVFNPSAAPTNGEPKGRAATERRRRR
jgi:hypothetical protein